MATAPAPAAAAPEEEDEFASVNSILITSSLLLLVAIGYRINTHRLRHVPVSGAAMALGFVLGVLVRVMGITEEERLLNFKGSFFFYVLLPPIIFEAGLSLETQMFVDNLGAIFTFAVLGTLVSTWVTSKGLRLFAELGAIGLDSGAPRLAIHCHLFGALISATDPVATIALFGGSRFRADPLLHSLLNGESVLNDAVAIALFSTLSQHLDEEEPRLFSLAVLGHFFFVSACSLVLGLVAGALCSWCFCRSRFLSLFPDYEISAMCLGAYLTFAFSQLLGLSGIVALFFFGVVLAQYNYYNLSDRSKIASQVTFGTLAKLAESCVFVYLGVVAALSMGRFHWHLGLVVFTILVITVARAAHIFPLTGLLNIWRQRKINQNMSVVMWISGLRGAIAFALSLRLPCTSGLVVKHGAPECRNSDLLVTTTISIVMLTTLVVGTAMEHVMTALRVIEAVPPGADSAAGVLHSPTRSALADGLSRADSSSALAVPLATRSSHASPYGTADMAPGGSPITCSGAEAAAGGGAESSRLPRVGDGNLEGGGSTCEIAARRSRVAAPAEAAVRQDGGPGPWEPTGRGGGLGGSARSLLNARGWLYQAFARFDLNYLQPALGGPIRNRGGESPGTGETVELPSLQGFIAPQLGAAEEDPPAAASRAAVFE